ncbi:hypothetical protein [Nocardioides alcanivorans]|uniref:hypothetical protein n=1 Tax=Nocardioides alcanivorans TaxID=2897352 RepID=UPI001F48B135|nr:hypothetical protein [Nocardioides alcanivorans]
MRDHVEIRTGAYADSVTLLQVSRTVQDAPGVTAAQVAMGTELNLEVLERMGFTIPEGTGPVDMLVALRLDDDADLDAALRAVDAALAPRRQSAQDTTLAPPRTTGSALDRVGDDTVVLVSTPAPTP